MRRLVVKALGVLFVLAIAVVVVLGGNKLYREYRANERLCVERGMEFVDLSRGAWACRDPRTGLLYRP